jgi:hypothetical protein
MATDSVSNWSRDERREIFQETAIKVGVGSPIAIEKDYWVYWILQRVFDSASGQHLVFKGGTSLSKVFQIIKRFSEDIDLSVDRTALGFSGDRDPENAKSKTHAGKLLTEIRAACNAWVSGEFAESLRTDIGGMLKEGSWELRPDANDSSTLLFEYPYSLEETAYGGASYIRPIIRLEFGGRGEVWPANNAEVNSYCAEAFPDAIHDRPAAVNVLRAERTFWEKATLAHAEFHRQKEKSFGERLSRHYYDLAMMDRAGTASNAIVDEKLRRAVVEHKSVFFPAPWARYDLAVPGTFRIYPHPGLEQALRSDYRLMEEMFFETPPPFDELLGTLKSLEGEINRS